MFELDDREAGDFEPGNKQLLLNYRLCGGLKLKT